VTPDMNAYETASQPPQPLLHAISIIMQSIVFCDIISEYHRLNEQHQQLKGGKKFLHVPKSTQEHRWMTPYNIEKIN